MYSPLSFLRRDHDPLGFPNLSSPAASYHGIRCCIGFVVIVFSFPNWLAGFLFSFRSRFLAEALLTLCLFLLQYPTAARSLIPLAPHVVLPPLAGIV